MNKFFEPTCRGRHISYAFLFVFILILNNVGFGRAAFVGDGCDGLPPTPKGEYAADTKISSFFNSMETEGLPFETINTVEDRKYSPLGVGGKYRSSEFTFKIDLKTFKTKLSSVPNEKNITKKALSSTIQFHLPSGEKKSYTVAESQIMEASGEQLYDYKSYVTFEPKTGEMTGRFSVSKNGVNGIFEEKGRLFSIKSIDNISHKSVFDDDMILSEGCFLSAEEEHQHKNTSTHQQKKNDFSYGQFLRVFRIAVTNRGELYARAVQLGQHLPTVLADYINQVNFIYEKELSIRLQVVTPILTFTDKNTDPFTTANTFDLIQESRTAIDQLYADQSYDLGHLFGYFGGGRAYLNSICANNKSGAVTGMDLPLSSPFLRLFAHELGHQFGAGHSFNSDGAFCGQNVFPASAYELGSGSTLMSYAGSCVNENVESVRSKYFNSGALEEINSFVESKIAQGCGRAIWIGNNPPNVEVPTSKTIPARTPFFLEGTATDSDDNSLIYSWEQHDLGPVGLLGNEAARRPSVPLFRVYDPVLEPKRMFPNLSAILYSDNLSTYEILPKVSRSMSFYLTARDQRGGVGCNEVELQVHDTGKPFKVLNYNLPQVIRAGSSAILRWGVSGTNQPPISTAQVDILFSTDGGLTFPISLKRNTANDGKEFITFPAQAVAQGRIMVRAEGNYFFDINNADLQLIDTPPPPPAEELELTFSANPTNYRQWSNVVFSVEVKNNSTIPVNNLEFSIPPITGKLVFGNAVTSFGNYNSFLGHWNIPHIAAGGTATLTLTFFTLVRDEIFEVKATQIGGNLTKTVILRPFNTATPKPDLFLKITKSPMEADPGAFLTSDLVIENSGTDAARGNFMIGVYLSSDQNIDASDIQLGTIATGNIPIGSLPTTAGYFIPADRVAGDYFLIYFVDNQQVISEMNEGNNIIFAPFKIKGSVIPPASDCSITSITSQKRCFDNGTPENPDDDQFSFNLQFLKQNSQPGNFQSQIGDISRAGVYGGVYIFGPFPIAEGNVSGHVEDVFSPNCYSNFIINPTATCSTDGAVDYCESKSNHPWHEWIAGVAFAGRQNNSSKKAYSDFTGNPIAVSKGQTVNVELTAGFSWFTADEHFRIWLDSNRDGQFSNDEIIFQKTLFNPGDGTLSASVSGTAQIPFSAKTGMARMRVSMRKNGVPNACGDLDFGEVEDYMVLIGGD